MLRPATGAGAKPRIGLSGAGVEASSGGNFEASSGFDLDAGLAFGSSLLCGSCLLCEARGWSAGTAALAFFGDAGVAADFALLSMAGACFCLSSASSVSMRCSIFSSFFNKTSLVSPSAAPALPQPRTDIAVAASNALRLTRRSLCNFDTSKLENRCNDMTTPQIRGNQSSATPGQLTPLQNIFGIRNG